MKDDIFKKLEITYGASDPAVIEEFEELIIVAMKRFDTSDLTIYASPAWKHKGALLTDPDAWEPCGIGG